MEIYAKPLSTVEGDWHVYQDVKTFFQVTQCMLLEWICNNQMLTQNFLETDRSEAKNKTFEVESQTSSLLGIQKKCVK